MRSCAAGQETTCVNGMLSTITCAFGCAGDGCLEPRSCQSAGDISAGGTFADSSGGYADGTSGSCSGGGGVDVVTRLATADWRTVYLTTAGSSYDTVLYSRLTCEDPDSELPLSGPCPGALDVAGASMCNDNGVFPTGPMMGKPIPMGGSVLALCSLPPGVPVYTVLDGRGGGGKTGGPYALDVILAPRASSLNSCAEAGNLLDGNQRSFQASTTGHANAFTSTASCLPGDSGSGAPDAVFFVTLTAPRTLTVSTRSNFAHVIYARRSPCNTADLGCAASVGNQATLTTVRAGGRRLLRHRRRAGRGRQRHQRRLHHLRSVAPARPCAAPGALGALGD